MGFFTNLNFSSSNEDGETELAALAGAQRIICLTGTGTRALDLLLSDAEEVIALDANPVQNALLSLKIAAIETLAYADYLAFLGIAPTNRRRQSYALIRDKLPSDARHYWDNNQRLIATGVWHAGRWEKLLRWNARFLRLFRGTSVTALMKTTSLGEQAEIWKRGFTTTPLLSAIETAGRDLVWRLLMREPAGAFLPTPNEVGKRIETDFERASCSFLFRESDVATLTLLGQHSPDKALPIHLRAENYERVRSALPKLRPMVGTLADLAKLAMDPCDGFSLSDFGSYCGPEDYRACWKGIVAVAAPKARYCERIFMNEMDVPFAEITINHSLSESLSRTDKAIIYRIRTGIIERTGR